MVEAAEQLKETRQRLEAQKEARLRLEAQRAKQEALIKNARLRAVRRAERLKREGKEVPPMDELVQHFLRESSSCVDAARPHHAVRAPHARVGCVCVCVSLSCAQSPRTRP